MVTEIERLRVERLRQASTIEARDDINKAAQMMLDAGVPTGHGETAQGLVGEALETIRQLLAEVERLQKRIAELEYQLSQLPQEEK